MTTEPEAVRRGRKRDPEAQGAILQVTRDLLLELGYTKLSIEAVAHRAGVGKSTIYRWWPTKGALILEATSEHLEIGTVPDTGDTRRDLVTAAQQLIETFSDRLASIVIFAVIAQLDQDPLVAATFRDTWVYPWRESAARAIARGFERGDIPSDADPDLLLDVLVGTVFQRTLVLSRPSADGLAEALVDMIVSPGS
jgi:AcrR family transcriptional regulator